MENNTNTSSLFPADSQNVINAVWTTMFLYVAYTVGVVVLLVWRWNKQPVRVREPLLLVYHAIIICILTVLTHARILSPRSNFPCFLFSLIYYFGIPEIFLPHFFRMYRFFLIFKVSKKVSTDASSKSVTILKKLLQFRVIFAVIGLLTVLHIAIWLTSIGIITATTPDNQFTAHGCPLGINTFTGMAIIAIYILLEVIAVIILLTGVKDTWGIRLEIVCLAISWALTFIVFAILNFVPQYISCCEYTAFPAGYIVLIGTIIDTLITCVLPCLLSFLPSNNFNNRATEEESKQKLELLDKVLINDKYRAQLKVFAINSFCPESLLFWEDVTQQYNNLKDDVDRAAMIRVLYDKYLSNEAPVELNLPDKTKTVKPIMDAVAEFKDNGTPLPNELLEKLINHCKNDMMDFFARYQTLAEWRIIKKEIETMETQAELMEDTGMTRKPSKRAVVNI